jgi:hypothetical protein
MSYGDFNKNPVYEDKWSSTNLLLLEDLLIRVSLWQQDKWQQGNSPARNAQAPLAG